MKIGVILVMRTFSFPLPLLVPVTQNSLLFQFGVLKTSPDHSITICNSSDAILVQWSLSLLSGLAFHCPPWSHSLAMLSYSLSLYASHLPLSSFSSCTPLSGDCHMAISSSFAFSQHYSHPPHYLRSTEFLH